jgi:hypothetical protein
MLVDSEQRLVWLVHGGCCFYIQFLPMLMLVESEQQLLWRRGIAQ